MDFAIHMLLPALLVCATFFAVGGTFCAERIHWYWPASLGAEICGFALLITGLLAGGPCEEEASHLPNLGVILIGLSVVASLVAAAMEEDEA